MLYGELLRAVLAQHRERGVRLMTGDAVSASMAHEIKQPLSAMTMNANASLRWLDRAAPDLDEAKAALQNGSAQWTRRRLLSQRNSVLSSPPCRRAWRRDGWPLPS